MCSLPNRGRGQLA